jgi:hypothetical protein
MMHRINFHTNKIFDLYRKNVVRCEFDDRETGFDENFMLVSTSCLPLQCVNIQSYIFNGK